MFFKRVTLFHFFGFKVKADASGIWYSCAISGTGPWPVTCDTTVSTQLLVADADNLLDQYEETRGQLFGPEVKRRIGYLPQHPVLPRWVTPRELLRYASALHGLTDAAAMSAASLR